MKVHSLTKIQKTLISQKKTLDTDQEYSKNRLCSVGGSEKQNVLTTSDLRLHFKLTLVNYFCLSNVNQ